jgi:transposase
LSYGPRARWCNWPPLRLARVRCERESVSVVCPPISPAVVVELLEVMVRSIGLDVHRDFCEVALRDGGVTRSAGRIETSPEQLEPFARSLAATERVALEAAGNAWAIARLLIPYLGEVVLAHPKKLRAIAEAKVKTDKVDARVLAELLAADSLPRVWVGDEPTRTLRRLVARRRGLVKRRTQVKNEIQAVLHRNLKPRPPVIDCSASGVAPGSPSRRFRSTNS